MKRIGKHGTYAILGLTAVSLIGIGFSSWIINAFTEKSIEKNVTVTAGSFDDKRFDFKVTNVSDGTIKFDSLLNGDSDVITGSGDKDEEDLDFSFTCSINKSASISTDLAGIYVKFSDTTGETDKINDLVTADIIQTPISFGENSSDATNGSYGYLLIAGNAFNTPSVAVEATYDEPAEAEPKEKKYTCTIKDSGDTYSIEITFNFAWGSAFGYENPTNVSSTDGHYGTTIAGLKTLDAADDLGLTVTLTAVAA